MSSGAPGMAGHGVNLPPGLPPSHASGPPGLQSAGVAGLFGGLGGLAGPHSNPMAAAVAAGHITPAAAALKHEAEKAEEEKKVRITAEMKEIELRKKNKKSILR